MTAPTRPSERTWGRTVGGVAGLLAVHEIWRGRVASGTAAAALALVLLSAAAARPSALRLPCQWWWQGARALGWVNARVLLTALFVCVLTPLGVLIRVTGHDPLRRRHQRGQSGWAPSPERLADTTHYRRMF